VFSLADDGFRERLLTRWLARSSRKTFYYQVQKGPDFSTTIAKLETDLTVELLNSYVRDSALGLSPLARLTFPPPPTAERGRRRLSRSTTLRQRERLRSAGRCTR
jgi:hypothetical protein